jgi:hypothetical protein
MPENRISDTITHVTLNTINDVVVIHHLWFFYLKHVFHNLAYMGLVGESKHLRHVSNPCTIALHWVPIPMPMPMPTHTHGFWVGMGAMLLFMGGHGWAHGFVHPCIQLQIGVKLLGCMEYTNQ